MGMKNKSICFIFSFLLMFALPLQVSAAEGRTIEKTIVASSDEEYKEKAESEFAETIDLEGKEYRLDHIDYVVEETKYLANIEKIVDVTGEPDQTITESGIVYTLEKAGKQEKEDADPQIVTVYEDFDHNVTRGNVPQTKDVTATDALTGETVEVTCSLTEIEPVGIQYIDNVMTITIRNYDAAYYEWNGNYIKRNEDTPPLAGYEAQLLDYCDAADGSEITSFYWAGNPYTTSDGVVCRDAAADVRQTVQMYRAHYSGEIEAPETDPVYKATYTAPDRNGDVEMTVKATATYSLESVPIFNYVITGFIIAAILAALFLLIFIFLAKKKEKQKGRDV